MTLRLHIPGYIEGYVLMVNLSWLWPFLAEQSA
jgi:hypothetical protein